MDHSINILNELQAISPAVARIGRELPYEAPAGYFEALPALILQRIQAQEATLPPVLQEVTGNPYTVPAGYFESLPQAILARVKAEQASNAQEELAALSPLLSRLDKKLPFEAPAGYFTELSENVVSGARAIDFVNEELENLSPLMSSLQDKIVYEAPADYFEALPGQLLQRVKKTAVPAKVVSMGKSRSFLRYAAAAVVAGIIAISAWWLTDNSGTSLTEAVATKVDKISEAELQSYLDDQSALVLPTDMLATNNSRPELEAGDMHDLLQNVSDEEIQKYLELNTLTKHTATN